jgi:hypothetical protein
MNASPDAFRWFIGYDEREADAYKVTRDSILRHASIPLCVQPLSIDGLRRAGLYQRSYMVDGPQKYDIIDNRPFSTDFAFSRFLVPALCQYQGFAGFCDVDFLFRADIAGLLAEIDFAASKAVWCVKHDYRPASSTKMDGQRQEPYDRKNWSSLMVFNCAHPSVKANLRPSAVNEREGRWLHTLKWCETWHIGELPEAWNWLEGHSSPDIEPKAVHYTNGIPTMAGYEKLPYNEEWFSYLRPKADGSIELERAADRA